MDKAMSTIDNPSAKLAMASTAGGLKRTRSATPEEEPSFALMNQNETELRSEPSTAMDHTEHRYKKGRVEQISQEQDSTIHIQDTKLPSIQDPQLSTAHIRIQMNEETATNTATATSPIIAECVTCGDHLITNDLVKAPCEHYYCKDCFDQFIAASLQTHDGFPPKCCNIPIAFIIIADNVSSPVFSRYSARQAEIKNALPLCCGVQGCGVRIENDRIEEFRSTCMACRRLTCTLCRGAYPRSVNGENVGHVCKRHKGREQMLALAKQEGWQICYHCGDTGALNFGCHHMR